MNLIHQLIYQRKPIHLWKDPGALRSAIQLPNAPQFWIELIEVLVNWLIRVCRLREPLDEEEISVRAITVDRAQMGRAVSEHWLEYYRQEGEPPAQILMGRDCFQPLIGEIHQEFSFEACARFRIESRYQRLEYQGVKVTCIPWMNGMIALPKDL